MNLVYISPVPWSSFTQRPHKLVKWFHEKKRGEVLWIDPYPTRLPIISDFRRLSIKSGNENNENPSWLKIIKPIAIPVEPLPFSGLLNTPFWASSLKKIDRFSRQARCKLVIGKPSVFSLTLLNKFKEGETIYDAMDDFPAFYSGFSRYAMYQREKEIVKTVDFVFASATAIKEHWTPIRSDIQLLHNGLDKDLLPKHIKKQHENQPKILGYVGTINNWFDWNWINSLAKIRPRDTVRLIGPTYPPAPPNLPKNIEFLPACSHKDALLAMQHFDVGLIPFKRNDLTKSVDPIKYYEYRALGLPVVSTNFGEMRLRNERDATYLCESTEDINLQIKKALSYDPNEQNLIKFIDSNCWEMRFNQSGIL